MPLTQQRRVRIAWGLFIGVLTAFAVFVLPFFFPPDVPSWSSAYAAGANNRVAEIAVGLLSLTVAFAALRSGNSQPRTEPQTQPLSRRWLWWSLAGMTIFLVILGGAMVRANIFYGEAEYFLTQLEKGLRLHLLLYRTIQFAYGPVLYWWPMLWMKALQPLGIANMPAYVGSLITTQAAGIALLFYTVSALPLRRGLKTFAFVAMVLGALPPTMGPNYSIFRFVVPMAFAVLLSRQLTLHRALLVATLGTMAGFAVSSEVGIAAIGGVFGFGICRAILSGRRWLWLLLAAPAGAAIFITLTGRAYFQMITDAGTGGYDLLLTPEPRTILLLIALVALSPIAVARAIRRHDASAGMLAAIYGTALGFMPVALGRCDSVHEFFFSLASMLLSLVAIDAAVSRTPARIWIACIAAWVIMANVANSRLYRPEFLHLAHEAIHPDPNDFDIQALERQLNGQPVFLVDDVSWTAYLELLDKGLLMPSFFCEQSNIWRRPAEDRKIAEMRAGNFALIPVGGVDEPVIFEDGPVARWKRLGLVYRERFTPYERGLLTDRELQTNWVRVATISHEDLYRKLR